RWSRMSYVGKPTSSSTSSSCRARSVATRASAPTGRHANRGSRASATHRTPRSSCSADQRRAAPRGVRPTKTSTRTDPPRMSAVEPSRDCPRCPRLVAFREAWRAREPNWFNAPVASFGAADARLLIVGLAPGLQGANRTGRPFTGDYAGVLLYETLVAFGFAH